MKRINKILALIITVLFISIPLKSQNIEFYPDIDTLTITNGYCAPAYISATYILGNNDIDTLSIATDSLSIIGYFIDYQDFEIVNPYFLFNNYSTNYSFEIFIQTTDSYEIPLDSLILCDTDDIRLKVVVFENGAAIDSLAHYFDISTGLNTNDNEIIVEEYSLSQNYPNPFNPSTTIQCELPQRSDVQITIYDLLGRKVTTLVSETQDAGYKSVIWNATNDKGKAVSAGVYFYQIRVGDYVQTRKMVVLR